MVWLVNRTSRKNPNFGSRITYVCTCTFGNLLDPRCNRSGTYGGNLESHKSLLASACLLAWLNPTLEISQAFLPRLSLTFTLTRFAAICVHDVTVLTLSEAMLARTARTGRHHDACWCGRWFSFRIDRRYGGTPFLLRFLTSALATVATIRVFFKSKWTVNETKHRRTSHAGQTRRRGCRFGYS